MLAHPRAYLQIEGTRARRSPELSRTRSSAPTSSHRLEHGVASDRLRTRGWGSRVARLVQGSYHPMPAPPTRASAGLRSFVLPFLAIGTTSKAAQAELLLCVGAGGGGGATRWAPPEGSVDGAPSSPSPRTSTPSLARLGPRSTYPTVPFRIDLMASGIADEAEGPTLAARRQAGAAFGASAMLVAAASSSSSPPAAPLHRGAARAAQ